ncbi:hypothetical protein [uncultured Allofournierella sp.]|uniref:hypothetical protein n=1 Tax=uncultured Allofournierella sp. TaxID=1940258 RepID=UPI0025E87B93|nr:hypothetical protein [uncultured Fournierella sp.]
MKKTFAAILSACILAADLLMVPVFALEAEPLDQAAKEALYEEYQTIAQQVAQETGQEISLLPMDKFTHEDWLTPEEFRAMLTAVAGWDLSGSFCAPDQPRSTIAARTSTLTADGQELNLTITGSFETTYSPASRRQHFLAAGSLDSEVTGCPAAWTQTDSETYLLDGARTCAVTVWGDLTISGAVFENRMAHAEFYCTANGAVY